MRLPKARCPDCKRERYGAGQKCGTSGRRGWRATCIGLWLGRRLLGNPSASGESLGEKAQPASKPSALTGKSLMEFNHLHVGVRDLPGPELAREGMGYRTIVRERVDGFADA